MDEDIGNRLEKLEKLIAKYMDSEYFRYIRRILSSYLKLIDLYVEHGRISPAMIFPEVKDPIEREILEILFHYGKMNVSEITNEMRKSRGKASRNTVRKKIEELEEKGLVECEYQNGKRVCMVSSYALKRWLNLIGIDIRIEKHVEEGGEKNEQG